MKKIISITLVLALSCACAFASFSGRSTIGVNYSLNDGDNRFGLSSDHTGYFGTFPVGYYIGLDADFSFDDASDWNINAIVGPSYVYSFDNAPVQIDIAIGASASADNQNMLALGVGGYIGASWSLSKHIDLLIGTKMGSNFFTVDLDDASTSVTTNFYVTPQFAIGFTY